MGILVKPLLRSPPFVHRLPIPLRWLPLVFLIFPLVLLVLPLVILLISPGWLGILRPLRLLQIILPSIIPIRLILWRTLGITVFPLITIWIGILQRVLRHTLMLGPWSTLSKKKYFLIISIYLEVLSWKMLVIHIHNQFAFAVLLLLSVMRTIFS